MLTWLRIVATCFCMVLCVLFAALWIESYKSAIRVYKRTVEDRPEYQLVWGLVASRGQIKLSHMDRLNEHRPIKWKWGRDDPFDLRGKKRTFGFGWDIAASSKMKYQSIWFPIWLPILISCLIAYAAKPKPRWQFGSRELLTLTSAVAITAGTFAALLRSISP